MTRALVVLLASSACTGTVGALPSDEATPGDDGGALVDGGAEALDGGSEALDGGPVTWCDVKPLLADSCGACHGAGTLTPLTTRAELAALSSLGGTMAERALTRMKTMPLAAAMPPNVGGRAADVALLEAWRANGLADCGGAPDAGSVADAGTPPGFSCTPGQRATTPLLRLTDEAYRLTLSSVLAPGLTATELRTALQTIGPRLAALPTDGTASGHHLTYDTQDQRISRLLVEPQLFGAFELATWISADPARLERFVRAFGGATPCATITTPACATAFINGFGKLALRRPVDADERTRLEGFFNDTSWGGHRAVIVGLLTHPSFIFRTEFRGAAVPGSNDTVSLTDWELASRLSYALTGAPPDAALLAAAQAHFLGTGKTLDEQASRLVTTPQARQHLARFYEQWLRLDRIPVIDSTAVPALGVVGADRPGSALPLDTDLVALRDDAFAELVTLMDETSAGGGSLSQALTTEQSFAKSPTLASIYGVTTWPKTLPDGGVDRTPVMLPAGERTGLFSRAGFLLSGFADPNPIKRGARLRVEYLCETLVPPDNIDPPAAYVPATIPTPRNVAVAKTEIPGTDCAGCHKPFINPLGFTFEQYDAFGRYRTQQPVTLNGAISWVPVDAHSVPNLSNGDPAMAQNAKDLAQLLARSEKFNACFARHALRYLDGREEDEALDGCRLQQVHSAAKSQSLRDTFVSGVRHPDFRLRRLTVEN